MAVAFPYYNFFVGLGVALAAVLFHRRLERAFPADRVTHDRAMLLVVAALPAALVGSWLFDRVTGAASGPIFPLRGFAFAGGLIAALATGLAGAFALRIPIVRLLDVAAPCIALGHAIGRIGCGMAGCCFGRHVDDTGLWHLLGFTRVPTQWLESAGLFAIALAVHLAPRDARREGDATAMYLAAYGVMRLALETLRDDPRGWFPILPHVFTPSQWVALAMITTATTLVATRNTRRHGAAATA